MVVASTLLLGRPFVNKAAYTLIEMLLVLAILSLMTGIYCFAKQPDIVPQDIFFYELETIIEKARFVALQEQRDVTLSFLTDRVCLENMCYLSNYHVLFENPAEFSFNQKGHIRKGGHVQFMINHHRYQLIFNVGQGAHYVKEA